jgi:hypothetical protein
MKQPKVKGVPVEYMDVDTLWNDRRDPHASPLASSPRRMYGRAPSMGQLGGALEGVYRGGQPTGPK